MGSVPKALTILLALAALLLMPVGMFGMPAAAASPDSPALTAAHCDGHDSEKGHAPASMDQHCATCIVVPTAEGPQVAPGLTPHAPRSMTTAHAFPGLEPEVSTPPPRQV